jgi:uncharacterized protein YjbJ (UPF0337 family)
MTARECKGIEVLSCQGCTFRQGKRGAASAAIYRALTKESEMKWEQIESDWKGYTPQVLAQWSKLTDAQLSAVAGKRDALSSKIQEVYAITKDEAEKQIKAFEERAKQPQAAKAPVV